MLQLFNPNMGTFSYWMVSGSSTSPDVPTEAFLTTRKDLFFWGLSSLEAPCQLPHSP